MAETQDKDKPDRGAHLQLLEGIGPFCLSVSFGRKQTALPGQFARIIREVC
jgi:hypothetical protein